MGFYEELFKQEDERYSIPITKKLEENLNKVKDILNSCDDVIYREFSVGQEQKLKFATVYAEGLADKNLINEYVLKNLMLLARMTAPDVNTMRDKIYALVKDGVLSVSDIKEVEDMNIVIDNILMGETVLMVDKWDKALVIASKGWPMRGVSEPDTEAVIRGSREGFVETMRVNTALVRRRIRDPRFKIKQMRIGKRSKTDIAVLFIDGIVNTKILGQVVRRLKNIDIDSIMESGNVEQLIEDNWRSPFPQVQATERPERIAAAVYEGRIGIIIDNTPFALIVPTTFNSLMQSSEDYNERFWISNAIRILRYITMLISLFLPALYIAMTSYHPGMIPTQLALYIAGSRDGVPFPAFIEAFLMEFSLEILREAGIRLPSAIGATIGIVGGLVLGQAAVEAGIVSSLMVIVVAITAISAYTTPSYSFALGFRLLRFIYMVFAATLGLYGLSLAFLISLTHLCNLKSFGVPYLTPFNIYNLSLEDFKDSFIMAPIHKMKKRPSFITSEDKNRLEDHGHRSNLEKGEDNNG